LAPRHKGWLLRNKKLFLDELLELSIIFSFLSLQKGKNERSISKGFKKFALIPSTTKGQAPKKFFFGGEIV
jgi:hypothetical protein